MSFFIYIFKSISNNIFLIYIASIKMLEGTHIENNVQEITKKPNNSTVVIDDESQDYVDLTNDSLQMVSKIHN